MSHGLATHYKDMWGVIFVADGGSTDDTRETAKEFQLKLLDIMTPLYYARVVSFVRESWDITSLEAENLVEDHAVKFEANKEYLLKVWDEKSPRKATQPA